MKLNSILSSTLIAAVATLSMGAQAADMNMASTASAPAAQTAPMKPHSHMEAKGGMAPKASEPKPAQSNPAKDMSKHYHPRDAK